MSDLRGPPIRATSAKQQAHVTLVRDQIMRGQELVERLSRGIGSYVVQGEYSNWHEYNEALLRSIVVSADASESYLWMLYRRLALRGKLPRPNLFEDLAKEIGDLESVADHLGAEAPAIEPPTIEPPCGRILVVHGRNEAAKEKVARFLMKLGLEPVLLDEEAAHGRTLIEKLEACSPVAFAVVLLTGDDVGALASASETPQPRARQNVIFELGFFIAKLGRSRVCAVYDEGVELPSDFGAVEYKPLDRAGAWKAILAKELQEGGVKFDLGNVL